jgi:hypothetical protein
MQRVRILPIATLMSLIFFAAAPAWAAGTSDNARVPAEFTGVLLSSAGAVTVPVTLHVDGFTTAAEVGQLSRLLGDNDPRRVVAALAEMQPRGWIRVGNLIGFEVPVIREFTTDKGTRIVAVLDRPFPLWEQLEGTRSPDAPFGMIELKLDLNGNGNGTLVPAGRVMFTQDGKVEIMGDGATQHRIIGVTQQPVGK